MTHMHFSHRQSFHAEHRLAAYNQGFEGPRRDLSQMPYGPESANFLPYNVQRRMVLPPGYNQYAHLNRYQVARNIQDFANTQQLYQAYGERYHRRIPHVFRMHPSMNDFRPDAQLHNPYSWQMSFPRQYGYARQSYVPRYPISMAGPMQYPMYAMAQPRPIASYLPYGENVEVPAMPRSPLDPPLPPPQYAINLPWLFQSVPYVDQPQTWRGERNTVQEVPLSEQAKQLRNVAIVAVKDTDDLEPKTTEGSIVIPDDIEEAKSIAKTVGVKKAKNQIKIALFEVRKYDTKEATSMELELSGMQQRMNRLQLALYNQRIAAIQKDIAKEPDPVKREPLTKILGTIVDLLEKLRKEIDELETSITRLRQRVLRI
jgi:hypothetical protein